jgi:hypothetical protein
LRLAARGCARGATVVGEFDAQIDCHHRLAAAVAIDPAQWRDVGVVASDRDSNMASIDGASMRRIIAAPAEAG